MSKTKRTSIDQALCDHARLLMAGGAKAPEAAEILGIGVSTLYRMKEAGYSAEAYVQNTVKERTRRRVELVYDPSIMEEYRKENGTTYSGTDETAEEQLPGQMRMEIPEDPDTQFDRNLRGVLEKLTNNSATFQEAMKEIRDEKKRLEEAAREHRESRIRINNLVAIIRDALNQLLKEL